MSERIGYSVRPGQTVGFVVMAPDGSDPLQLCSGGVLLGGRYGTAFPSLRAARAAVRRTVAYMATPRRRPATDPWLDPDHYRIVRVTAPAGSEASK